MKKHRAGHTDKTGGLPHSRRVRQVQNNQNKGVNMTRKTTNPPRKG